VVRDSALKGRSDEQAADTVSFCVNSYKCAIVCTNRTIRLYNSSVLLRVEVPSVELLQHRLTLAENSVKT
jgi:hypothetical protein